MSAPMLERQGNLTPVAQFGSDLDKATQEQLDRGRRLTELLKQPQYDPVQFPEQIVALYAGTRGYLDQIDVERVKEWETSFIQFLRSSFPDLLKSIQDERALSEALEDKLKDAINQFNTGWN